MLFRSVVEGLAPSNSPGPATSMGGGKYDLLNRRQLCKKILAKYIAYDPHDYVLDGICPIMDGFDLLATPPTGSGKTRWLFYWWWLFVRLPQTRLSRLGRKDSQRI